MPAGRVIVLFNTNVIISDILAGVNKLVFTFSCLTNFKETAESVINPTKSRIQKVFSFNFILQFFVVSGIGIMGYL